ncbi:acyl carrier protein [Winogradskyella sp. F6397]|uniref:Acyl carrier protein n=1 Tax=Winogradskyella marina TaxID=2785530 RepID=A0ABS0EGI0_9FLAO|nr:acyl carrier protein [Winogradskyella marina]MBF8149554.1 acyl carrier protein [Winogradskyella marina]
MQRNNIVEKVKEILISVLEHEGFELTDDLVAADVSGWDSLTHMIIISSIEEEFKIKFKLKDLNKMRNIGALIDIISSKIS